MTEAVCKKDGDKVIKEALLRWTEIEASKQHPETLGNEDTVCYREMRKERLSLLIARWHYRIDLFLE